MRQELKSSSISQIKMLREKKMCTADQEDKSREPPPPYPTPWFPVPVFQPWSLILARVCSRSSTLLHCGGLVESIALSLTLFSLAPLYRKYRRKEEEVNLCVTKEMTSSSPNHEDLYSHFPYAMSAAPTSASVPYPYLITIFFSPTRLCASFTGDLPVWATTPAFAMPLPCHLLTPLLPRHH